MWVPRIAVESWLWFAVGYLLLLVVSSAALVRLLMRLCTPGPLMARWVAGYVSTSVSLFMWSVGAPVWFALMLGAGMVPAVLVVFGGSAFLPQADDRDADGR